MSICDDIKAFFKADCCEAHGAILKAQEVVASDLRMENAILRVAHEKVSKELKEQRSLHTDLKDEYNRFRMTQDNAVARSARAEQRVKELSDELVSVRKHQTAGHKEADKWKSEYNKLKWINQQIERPLRTPKPAADGMYHEFLGKPMEYWYDLDEHNGTFYLKLKKAEEYTSELENRVGPLQEKVNQLEEETNSLKLARLSLIEDRKVHSSSYRSMLSKVRTLEGEVEGLRTQYAQVQLSYKRQTQCLTAWRDRAKDAESSLLDAEKRVAELLVFIEDNESAPIE